MVAVHGHDGLVGDTVFAFFVVRLAREIRRDELIELLRFIAPLIPDSDTFIEDLPDDLEHAIRILAMPWAPPEAGHAVDAQRRLIDATGALGVEAAWFFQTGTSLPADDEDEGFDDDDGDDEDGDDDDESSDVTGRRDARERATTESSGLVAMRGRARTKPERGSSRAMTADDSWVGESSWNNQVSWTTGELGGGDTKTTPIEIVDMTGERDLDFEDDDIDDDRDANDDDEGFESHDDEAGWSHGPPPQVRSVRFPVDGYPVILRRLDWEDVGVAVKLRGDMEAGEGTVLLAFHTLWLAPYSGRYRNAAVTIDRVHHAAHLWVDRFAVPCSPEQQVHHLLWILGKLDEVVPILHARFVGASTVQKYAGLAGEAGEPFVLGGNPLRAVYAEAGDPGVERWIAEQTVWSPEEVARMLRDLAADIASGHESGGLAASAETPEVPTYGGEEDEGDDDDDEDDDEDDDDDDDDDEDDDDEAEGNEDEDRGRHITSVAGVLIAERARAGILDPRAAEHLLSVLRMPDRFEQRRRAIVQILGALRHGPAVPALVEILEHTTVGSVALSIGKEELVAAAAAALGAIGDPAAIPALAQVVAAPGTHHDEPRPIAAHALASCLAATPPPRQLDEAVLAQLLTTIRDRNDGELNAESQLAYGRLVHQLPPERRADARQRLADSDSARDDAIALLARQAALVLASPTTPAEPPPRDLAMLLHDSLTSLAYDHEYTVRNLRIALRVAEIVPEVVDPADLVWLTRFSEPELRAGAHALLAHLGAPLSPAPVYDRLAVRSLGDDALVHAIGELHVVGRSTLVAEAARRDLARARPAIVDACHDVISRARQAGEDLLDPDTQLLEAAVPYLRVHLDEDVLALFERMLRHPNHHVKRELVQDVPRHARLERWLDDHPSRAMPADPSDTDDDADVDDEEMN